MPEPTIAPAAALKKKGLLTRWLPETVPGCASLTVLFFLLCVVAVVWIAFFLDPNNLPWRHAISWGRIASVILLALAIPLVVYFSLRLWLEGEKALYPEIDNAWAAGIAALEEQGLDIRDMALYVIIGSRGVGQERAIMRTGQLDLRLEGVPEGPAPLHWYATYDSVYLFCSDASWSSALAAKRQRQLEEFGPQGRRGPSRPVAPPRPAPAPPRSTLPPAAVQQPAAPQGAAAQPPLPTPPAPTGPLAPPAAPGQSPSSPSGAGGSPGGYMGTVQVDQFLDKPAAPAPAAPAAPAKTPAAAPAPDYMGTIQLDPGNNPFGSPDAPQAPPPQDSAAPPTYLPPEPVDPDPPPVEPSAWAPVVSDTGSEWEPIVINSGHASERIGRLTYLCQQINRVREPLCPINGVLSLVPYGAIDAGAEDAAAMQQAVKSDLTTLHYVLQVRCPVTALIVDMERQTGFRELMRRVGRERVSVQRFGRRYDCRSVATAAEMDALAELCCGTIEDWVYALFREDEALTRPGNQQLYRLLCEFRSELKGRLADLLQSAFAYDPEQGSPEDALLFSGCYFAATGERSDQRAFIGGIHTKLADEQELVEWTSDALLTQQSWERLSLAGLIAIGGLAVALAWQLLR